MFHTFDLECYRSRRTRCRLLELRDGSPLTRRRQLRIFLVWWIVTILSVFALAAAFGEYAPRIAFTIWAIVVCGGFIVYAMLFSRVYFARCRRCGDFFFRTWYGMTPWRLLADKCIHCGDQPKESFEELP